MLGAGTSVLGIADELELYGWSMSGWFPGEGPLRVLAAEHLPLVLGAERPIAFSRRGWSESPGVRSRAARVPGYARALRAALHRVRPHVVHANTLLTLPEAAVARSCGLPVVLQAHELPPPSRKRDSAVRVAGRIADVLVGVSDPVSSMLRDGAGKTPVSTVYNGTAPRAPGARPEDRPFTIGTVGTVSRVKGTDVFVRAAQLALHERPGLRFEHVGASDLHRDAGLDDELVELVVGTSDGSITMRGPLPAEEVLPGWDVFVLASRTEGFPLVTLEAMAAGLPVIATSVGGVPEQIAHLENGILVAPDDPTDLASWMVRLHDDVDLRRRLGDAALARVSSRFTLARQAEGLHRAYLAALDLRFGPRAVRRLVRTSV